MTPPPFLLASLLNLHHPLFNENFILKKSNTFKKIIFCNSLGSFAKKIILFDIKFRKSKFQIFFTCFIIKNTAYWPSVS